MRSHPVLTIIAGILASPASAQADVTSVIVCQGRTMQNACKQQPICIDDPRTLSETVDLSLSLGTKTYTLGKVRGNITSIEHGRRGTRILKIAPAPFGGEVIELSSDSTAAKLVGGEHNYFFRCGKSKQ
jgi:hypothetical protein